jgi:hypothetical protein
MHAQQKARGPNVARETFKTVPGSPNFGLFLSEKHPLKYKKTYQFWPSNLQKPAQRIELCTPGLGASGPELQSQCRKLTCQHGGFDNIPKKNFQILH